MKYPPQEETRMAKSTWAVHIYKSPTANSPQLHYEIPEIVSRRRSLGPVSCPKYASSTHCIDGSSLRRIAIVHRWTLAAFRWHIDPVERWYSCTSPTNRVWNWPHRLRTFSFRRGVRRSSIWDRLLLQRTLPNRAMPKGSRMRWLSARGLSGY